MTKVDVLFEKWHDPFFDDASEAPAEDDLMTAEEAEGLLRMDGIEPEEMMGASIRPTPFLATSMGPMSITEHTQPSKVFNFWVGHSNTQITTPIGEAIAKVEGVEVLTVFSRYRFRVGIGKMFKDGKVFRDIRKAILNEARLSSEQRFPKL